MARASDGGILIEAGADYNIVAGNHVGVDASATSAIPNAWVGLAAENSTGNLIGGPSASDRNIISGNSCGGPPPPRAGVRLDADGNIVQGNYIGTDADGIAAFPAQGNGYSGVWCRGYGNSIFGNLISGNSLSGIDVWGSHTTISGNLIGTDATGSIAIGNQEIGIQIANGASDNLVGGSNATPGARCTGDCNLISGHASAGILVDGSDTISNSIRGKYVETTISGTSAVANGMSGIYLRQGANRNRIGGFGDGEGNLLSLNRAAGVMISGTTTLSNTVTRNSIFSNIGAGIDNVNGGNQGLEAPSIVEIAASGYVTGTVCSECTVEVFSDADSEGRYFEGTALADVSGTFVFTLPGGNAGPCITATATDGGWNTSEF